MFNDRMQSVSAISFQSILISNFNLECDYEIYTFI